MAKNQNGFGLMGILIALVAIGIVCLTVWSVYQAQIGASKNYQAPTDDSLTHKSTSPYDGWEYYSNDKYGFSFKYPSGWQISETTPQPPEPESPTKQLLVVGFGPSDSTHDFMFVRVNDMTLAELQTNEFYSNSAASAISDIRSGTSITLDGYTGLRFNTHNQSDTADYFYEVKGKLIVFEDNFGNGAYHGAEAKLILDSFEIK